jgi:hypothetical protein
MKRKELVLLICFALIAILLYIIYSSKPKEGFEDSGQKSANGDVLSYQLLTSVMGPIRRLSSIILNPTNWKERISMASMTPTELARMHLQSQVE